VTAPDPIPLPTPEPKDLGLGRVVAQSYRGRFFSKQGASLGHKYGLGPQRTERAILAALNASWLQFIGWFVGALLLLNGIFAMAYRSLGPGALSGTDALGLSDPFLRALSFSVGVFTTTATDGVHAVGATAHWLVILESIVGMLFFVTAGGLVIARLTRPRMSLLFSESAIVAPYEGGRGLMFRMTNARPSELTGVTAQVYLIWYEMFDGVRERNFHKLELERDSVEFFSLHWTVVHPITASSPLRGVTPELLADREAEIVVSVSGHEETFSTRVTSRTSYRYDEVRWDVKFASIFAESPDGATAIDVERLSRTERLAEGATAKPAAIEGPDWVKRGGLQAS
jgi:inward rectifier potassium channel